MKKKAAIGLVVGILLVGAIVVAWIGLSNGSSTTDGRKTVVAVFPVTVDAFVQFQDEARQVLAAKNIDVHYFSAEGDPSRFQTVVNAALLKKPDVLVLVGTQITNTGLGSRYADSLPPVVSSCISDPDKVEQLTAIGIEPPRAKPVAILTDMPRQDAYTFGAQLIRRVIPSVRKVGIMFNNAEINSRNTASKMADALRAEGVEVLEGVVSSEEDVDKIATNLILQGAQLLIIPHDKYVIKKAATVVKIGMNAPNGPVPVFSLDDGTVRKDGAAFGVSVNYGDLGRITGETSLKILDGDDPATMPVIQQDTANAYFNEATWQRLGLPAIPEDIRSSAVIYNK